ncbi:Ethanolamine-phosphate cytidylyltransferase, partial [Perkinsus olseni]
YISRNSKRNALENEYYSNKKHIAEIIIHKVDVFPRVTSESGKIPAAIGGPSEAMAIFKNDDIAPENRLVLIVVNMPSPNATVTERKKVRGYLDGCFDIMHSGHYSAMRQAKAQCDVLIVGVYADEDIVPDKALPVMKQEERLARAAAASAVHR